MSSQKTRLPGLDLLRLLAVVLVLGRHAPTAEGSLKGFFTCWARGGWVGVDLFFVLSGFLVSGLLFNEYKTRNRITLSRFYVRRGWKIYPPFYLLLISTIIARALSKTPLKLSEIFSEVFFLQSYVKGIWNHTWSLAVEEHFYLCLPLVLILILKLRKGFKPIVPVAVGLSVLCLTLRVITWKYRPYTFQTHLFASHLRLDSLFFGVAIAYVYHFHSSAFKARLTPLRHVLIILGALLLVPPFVVPLEGSAASSALNTIGFTGLFVGSGMILIGVLLSSARIPKPLATLGSYSYSIYLWHMPVKDWILPALSRVYPAGFTLQFLIYAIGSLAIGVLLAKAIEVPSLALRDRWLPAVPFNLARPVREVT